MGRASLCVVLGRFGRALRRALFHAGHVRRVHHLDHPQHVIRQVGKGEVATESRRARMVRAHFLVVGFGLGVYTSARDVFVAEKTNDQNKMSSNESILNQMPESTGRDVCFALVEAPVNGMVMTCNPSTELIRAVVCAWIGAGGPDALRHARPDVIDEADEHWVTMPRSILKNFDISLGPGVGVAKIVAMHVRVFKIVAMHRSGVTVR